MYITLTYEYVEGNFDDVIKHFEEFWYELTKEYDNLDYFFIIEMQEGRDCWHLHTLIKDSSGKKLYIDNQHIAQVWGRGFVKTERLNDSNISDYLSKKDSKIMIPKNKKVYYKSRRNKST